MQQLGRYEIVAELGRGAMGAVFRARDPRIERTVAVKTISVPASDASSREEYRQRFFREARAAGRLAHPGIVTIYDVGEDEATQTPFIVMEFVDGQVLNELAAATANGRISLESALDLLRQVALALDYAHSQGIVHRDIKPANIIVTKDLRAKIADFGIAKVSLAEVTLAGHVLGTPAFMSPEQLSGKPIDGRSDLFSLGAIAYWLLTGDKPFKGASITEVCIQVATHDPRPATELDPALSPDVDHILGRALAKDPDQRYQRGKDVAADIQDLLSGRRPRSLASEEQTQVLPAAEGTTLAPPSLPGGNSITSSQHPGAGVRVAPPSANPPAGSRPAGKRRRVAILYSVVGALLALVAVALFAASFNRALPADLQIVGQYPFRSAEVYIWVDGDLRYHDELRAGSHPRLHPKLSGAMHVSGGAIALTLPVRAGPHVVRVRVDAPDDSYDRDVSIPGKFRGYSENTLQLDFNNHNLDLRWK
jgi:serine/threonine protein kinase